MGDRRLRAPNLKGDVASDHHHHRADTIDDIMHMVVESLLSAGRQIRPSKGPARELTGVLLEISDPRARLSRTETRGKPFSCLGELCWYLAKRNDLEFISYYIPAYVESADDGIIFGAYGPRIFDWKGLNQWSSVLTRLQDRGDSRQAVIQLFDRHDIIEEHRDVPCTCSLQFFRRNGRLSLMVTMRSNDVFLGLPHDVFCFTMLQEILARELDLELGTYAHSVGSLHLYDKNERSARQFIDEGWQSKVAMPPMPTGNPWPAIGQLLRAESILRSSGDTGEHVAEGLDAYWADLVRLLEVHRCHKWGDKERIKALQAEMSSEIFAPFIDIRAN